MLTLLTIIADAAPNINDPMTLAICVAIIIVVAFALIWLAYKCNGNPGGPDWRH